MNATEFANAPPRYRKCSSLRFSSRTDGLARIMYFSNAYEYGKGVLVILGFSHVVPHMR